jgi:hypothetical protein
MGFLNKLFGNTKAPASLRELQGSHLVISRASVEHLDLSPLEAAIEYAESTSASSGRLTVIELAVQGYDDSPLELYQIEEVTLWMRQAFESHKELLFWLSPGSLYLLILCVIPGTWRRRPDGSIETSLQVADITKILHDCWMHTFLSLRMRGATSETFGRLQSEAASLATDAIHGHVLGRNYAIFAAS